MDDSHAGHAHAEGEDRAHTRRSFLRRAGIAGALAAGLAGGAELAGMSPAYARSHKARTRNSKAGGVQTGRCQCSYSCSYTPGQCGNCGTGNCCFSCTSHCGNFKQCNSCSKRPSYAGCE